MEAVLRTNPASQFGAARAMVGVHVRVDDVCDSHFLVSGECRVGVHIGRTRVDDGGSDGRAPADEIGCASEIEVVVRTKNHPNTPGSVPCATGNPADLHSGNPSARRLARRPRALNTSTARSA